MTTNRHDLLRKYRSDSKGSGQGGVYDLMARLREMTDITVETFAEVLALPSYKRKWGLIVYVVDDGSAWQLIKDLSSDDLKDNDNWKQIIAPVSTVEVSVYYVTNSDTKPLRPEDGAFWYDWDTDTVIPADEVDADIDDDDDDDDYRDIWSPVLGTVNDDDWVYISKARLRTSEPEGLVEIGGKSWLSPVIYIHPDDEPSMWIDMRPQYFLEDLEGAKTDEVGFRAMTTGVSDGAEYEWSINDDVQTGETTRDFVLTRAVFDTYVEPVIVKVRLDDYDLEDEIEIGTLYIPPDDPKQYVHERQHEMESADDHKPTEDDKGKYFRYNQSTGEVEAAVLDYSSSLEAIIWEDQDDSPPPTLTPTEEPTTTEPTNTTDATEEPTITLTW